MLARLLPHWGRIAELAEPHAYVRKAVLNEFLGSKRRGGRVTPSADMSEWLATLPGPADAHAERDALLRRVRELPDRQRAAVVLRYFEDLSFTEIAEENNQ